jgi:exopolysaccharide biosynthesis protein
MNNDFDNKNFRINKFLAVIILILFAGLAGWLLGRSDNTTIIQNDSASNEVKTTKVVSQDKGSVKSLVSYSLPDGWKEAGCANNPEAVYIIPVGASDVDCGANPSSPVKLSVDPAEIKDCNELQNVSNVKKHVCISLYINDMRSLKATTEYLSSSAYGRETTINAYYLDTGSSVIKAEYIYMSSNEYQVGFDELVNSIKTL